MSYHSIPPFSTLPLKHSFMFGQVMQKKEICQLFLEELFGWEIEDIQYVEREKDLTDSLDHHGIRLDIYLRQSGRVYNVEMQTYQDESLIRRIRYYQSGIDREELRRGVPYRNLPDTFIIFLCDYDPVGTGKALYERDAYWKKTDIPYDDGTHVLLLNSRYTERNTSSAILEFLDYIRTNDDLAQYSSMLMNQTKTAVQRIRLDKEVGERYMTLEMMLQDERWHGQEEGFRRGREEGEAIGLERGREEGIQASIRMLRDLNIPREAVAEKLTSEFSLSKETAESYLKQYW